MKDPHSLGAPVALGPRNIDTAETAVTTPLTMMNLADPQLELIDPTPNVHSMFLHFDRTFFWLKLSKRCVVRWSKRMYSSAGTCSYEERGFCDIALSEPLLKLRPRKDLVETLLHEMIHAYLFVTNQDQDRSGHGPNFQAHMHRINRASGLNITIYHDFHEEVKLYLTHWWRCNGLCQSYRPYFGMVRRASNRAPGPSDYWWSSHQKNCGGTFIKIKEPKKRDKPEKKGKETNTAKPNADITKYVKTNINNNNKETNNMNKIQNDKPKNSILKDSSNVLAPKVGIKTNSSSILVETKKNVVYSPQVPKAKPVVINGTGQTISAKQPSNERKRTNSNDVLVTIRNVWSDKQNGTNNIKPVSKDTNSTPASNPNKHKPDYQSESPPSKVKKIDDYFKTTATTMLKDLYGKDFNITQSKGDQKLKAISTKSSLLNSPVDLNVKQSNKDQKSTDIPTKTNLVDCPVCSSKIDSNEINRHLDECLNKGVIEQLTRETIPLVKSASYVNIKNKVNNQDDKSNKIVKPSVAETDYKNKNILKEMKDNKSSNIINKQVTNSNIIDLTNLGTAIDVNRKRSRTSFDPGDLRVNEQIKSVVDNKNSKLRKSDGFKEPTSNVVQTTSIKTPTIIIEPSCSKPNKTNTSCPCCGDILNKADVYEHLDECLSFFENNTTIPEEGASTGCETIVIDDDDDDKFDESQTFNATGTKLPCPCCLEMIEEIDMNSHLDQCLNW